MANAIDRFRIDLSEKVRRISRNPVHEDSINEIVAHFEGIYSEARNTGRDEDMAEQEARRRIGSLHRMGLQIVDTPGRVRTGVRIQKAMLVGYTLTTVVYFLAIVGCLGRASLLTPAMEFLMGCGVLMGVGCFVARRFVWKGLVIGMLLSVLFGAVYQYTQLMNPLEVKKESEQKMLMMPRIQGVEEKLSNLFASSSQASFGKDLTNLETRIQAANVDYFSIDQSQKGQYLYPGRVDYPTNLVYSLRFYRTDDLNLASASFKPDSPIYRQWSIAKRDRIKSFAGWQEIYDHRNQLWLLGLKPVVRLALPTMILFLMMSGLGYGLGLVRLFGFDWIPVARKA